ncbi:MAG: aspartate kinase [Synergistaceae bacterium]|jgi:aspartate kinase|nr:aspartate kinase [Synergistaceae bacterium]
MTVVIVQKYGGSSVATPEKIRALAEILKKKVQDNKIVVIVSAMGKTTDNLIALAKEVAGETPDPRELDMLLVTGEQVSAALLAMALKSAGVEAISRNANQLQVVSTDLYGDARIKDINTTKLTSDLEKYSVVVVTGFQGVADGGDMTTLGRGSSDTLAVAIAAKLGTGCEIYSDVIGIHAFDPNKISGVKKLDYIQYDEMLELAARGAKVLHSRAVEVAKRYSVKLYCGSTFSDERGTYVVAQLPEWVEQPAVTGLAVDRNQTQFALKRLPHAEGILSILFEALAGTANVDMIAMAGDDITFTAREAEKDRVASLITKHLETYTGWDMEITAGVAKVSAVGVGMNTATGVAGRFFSALRAEGIDVLSVSTSEINISVLLRADQADRAVMRLANEFGLMES